MNILCLISFLKKMIHSMIFFFIKQDVRVVFSVTRMRSSNSARMNKFNFTTEKIGIVHMIVFEIVAHRNVDNWILLLT